MGCAKKLGQSLTPCQGVLMLLARIIYSRPLLDVSITPLLPTIQSYNLGQDRWNLVCLPILDQFPGPALPLGQGQSKRPCHIRLYRVVWSHSLLDDSCPSAILKFYCLSSLNYRAYHGLLVQVKSL